MNLFKKILFLLLMLFGLFYFLHGEAGTKELATKIETWLYQKQVKNELKISPQNIEQVEKEPDFLDWIGKTTEVLQAEYGVPIRKDPSAYDYTWWVYTDETDYYIQFGIKDKKIVTVYATGNTYNFDPIQLGVSYQEMDNYYEFEDRVSFATYTFEISEHAQQTSPLKQLGEDLFIQFYFDSYTETLSSFRLMTRDILLVQQPYDINYRGSLPEAVILSDSDWRKVEDGAEQQIFSITNIMRNRFNKKRLHWNHQAQEVAFKHSKDMAVNNYFSHYSQTGEGLKERLESNGIPYKSAGENIAAQYVDGPDAVEGWLNSYGHRQALLKVEYTDLGVGVYRDYYTQNFLQR